MSDDIDRLKTILEGIAQANDELKDISEAFRDVVDGVTTVDANANREGYDALRDLAGDIGLALTLLRQRVEDVEALGVQLYGKAGIT